MKHRCHCGLKEHFWHFRGRRLGILGIVLFVLHILFHVVECLVIPAILVAFGVQTAGESVEHKHRHFPPAYITSSEGIPAEDLIYYTSLLDFNPLKSPAQQVTFSQRL